MNFNIFKKDDVEEDFDDSLELELEEDRKFCDPEKPGNWCHFKYVSYKGMGMGRMKSAHFYFLVINWINWLAPVGYWTLWVFLKLDYQNNVQPIIDDALAIIDDITSLIAVISSSDPDGDGNDDTADDLAYVEA
jgi:hypothetical protein